MRGEEDVALAEAPSSSEPDAAAEPDAVMEVVAMEMEQGAAALEMEQGAEALEMEQGAAAAPSTSWVAVSGTKTKMVAHLSPEPAVGGYQLVTSITGAGDENSGHRI